MTRRSRVPVWTRPLLAIPVVAAVGAWAYLTLEARGRERVGELLQTVLRADVTALEMWLEEQRQVAAITAARSGVRQPVEQLVALARRVPADAAALRGAPAQTALAEALSATLLSQGYGWFLVLDSEAIILASSLGPESIGRRVRGGGTEAVERVARDGKPVVIPPRMYDVLGDEPAMFVLAAVVGADSEPLAVLAFELPATQFTRILNVARFGTSGETYAFDANGVMLSESRFGPELAAAGLLPQGRSSVARLELRDPGGSLREGHRPSGPPRSLPFTRMAGAATTGEDGVDLDGYRDYRGERVVGAWRWLGEHGFGVATEMDVAEAFAFLAVLRNAFRVLIAMLVLAAAGLAFSSGALRRMGRQVERAQRLGQYTLEAKIGEGGMGAVYRARHALLRRPTAIKLIRADRAGGSAIARFEREVQLTSQLSHPNTVAIYDFGHTPDGVFYYVMEHLEGVSLDRLIKGTGPLPEARIVHVLRQACGALAEAHGRGLVHRDVKPANVMLCVRGGVYDLVKVLDFGLVKEVETGGDKELTAANVMVGTPLYLSPEAIRGANGIDARSDVYALGAVAYGLLTGQDLFPSSSAVEVLGHHLHTAPEPPSQRLGREVDPFLQALILDCLQKDPARRPRDAGELLERLEGWTGPAWSQAEARAWWQASGRELLATAGGPATASRSPHLEVDLGGRLSSGPSDPGNVTRTRL